MMQLFKNVTRKFSTAQPTLGKTFLHDYHIEAQKAKMVEFAGYNMPVQYPIGLMKEHLYTRDSCGVFDVSHMGQVLIQGAHASEYIERISVADTQALKNQGATLSLLMNDKGGIKDDTIISKIHDKSYYMVVNAGCKDKDLQHMHKVAKDEFSQKDLDIIIPQDLSLVAVQGPKAMHIMEQLLGTDLKRMNFMTFSQEFKYEGEQITLSRCGYTGEDGFEISMPDKVVVSFVEKVLSYQDDDGKALATMVGLGARDSLRLEAGLCLYGHEMEEDVTPIQAMLAWTISKRRKAEGGFLGSDVVLQQIADGVTTKRCGFISGKVPIREGAKIYLPESDTQVGYVTSGQPSPSLKHSLGMAYVDVPHNKFKTQLVAKVRNKDVPITIKKMPFVPANYYKVPEEF